MWEIKRLCHGSDAWIILARSSTDYFFYVYLTVQTSFLSQTHLCQNELYMSNIIKIIKSDNKKYDVYKSRHKMAYIEHPAIVKPSKLQHLGTVT